MTDDAPIKMMYGMSSTRTDDDVIEEVQDALDDINEEEWDLLSWRRSSATRFVIRASVRCRAIQTDPELKIRVLPLGAILDDMGDPRNEWLIPKKVKDSTPHEVARKSVERWSKNLWPDSVEETQTATDNSEEVQEGDPEEDSKPRISAVKTNPTDDVLQAFGLTGNETDEDGMPFNLVSFDTNQD